jgi:enamine deaminase RidA (YjgF/YER057c/UK114 family)
MDIHAELNRLDLKLPPAPASAGSYLQSVRSGNLILVSGQIPMIDGQSISNGPVPSVAGIDQGRAAARQCVLNALAVIDQQLGGDWSKFVRVLRLGVYVCSDPDFTDQPKIANAGSELLKQLFGPAGEHVRLAVGMISLPLGVTVELEMIVECN